jgi:iron complex outermembrane recepter protein
MNFFRLLTAITLLSVSSVFSAESSKNTDSLKTFATEGVNVSATKAKERESPVPFSELSATEIEKTKSNLDIPHLLNSEPSVISYSENGGWIGYSNLTLRGFDQRRIAVYVNGIPQNDPEDHNLYWLNYTDLFESVGSIQIQRGAGVANYGAASIGGSINMETSLFAQKPSIKLYSGIGYQEFASLNKTKFNSQKRMAEFSSGIVDNKYAFYGKISETKSEGYRNNSGVDVKSYFLSGVRYDENLTTQVNIYGTVQEDALAYGGLPKEYATNDSLRTQNLTYWEYDGDGNIQWPTPTRPQEKERFSSPHFEIINDWKISENIKIKSSLYFFSGEGYFDYSGAGWADRSLGLDPTNGFADTTYPSNSILRGWIGNKQFGWIPTLVWDHQGGKLSTGLEIRKHSSVHWGKIAYAENLPLGFDPDYKFFDYKTGSDIYSLFVREQYNLLDELILSADVRVTYQNYFLSDEKIRNYYTEYNNLGGNDISGEGELFNIPYFFINPRIGFNWNPSEDLNVYSSLAYTVRPPRRQNIYDADFAFAGGMSPNFKSTELDTSGTVGYDFTSPNLVEEKMIDIELGLGYKISNYKINANVYLMEFVDELAYQGLTNAYGLAIAQNVNKTRHIGLEIDVSAKYKLFNKSVLSLNMNTTISSNKIIEFSDDKSKNELFNGRDLGGFPSVMMNFGVNYNISEFNIGLTGKYVGEMDIANFAISEAETLDAYFVVNSNISYLFVDLFESTDIKIHAQINNLTNQFYIPYAIGGAYFPAAERSYYFGIELEL